MSRILITSLHKIVGRYYINIIESKRWFGVISGSDGWRYLGIILFKRGVVFEKWIGEK